MRSRTKKQAGFLCALAASAAMLFASATLASAAPIWRVESAANTTVAQGGLLTYNLKLFNAGPDSVPMEEVSPGKFSPVPIRLNIELPDGLTAVSTVLQGFDKDFANYYWTCPGGIAGNPSITCTMKAPIGLHEGVQTQFEVSVDPGASGILTPRFELSGGGAVKPASAGDPTRVSSAPPGYGVDGFDAQALAGQGGDVFTSGGGHPYSVVNFIDVNRATGGRHGFDATPVEALKDAWVDLPPGLIGAPAAAAQCTLVDLGYADEGAPFLPLSRCSPDAQVGQVMVPVAGNGTIGPLPIYNMPPPPGAPARFGFNVLGTVIVLDARLNQIDGEYRISLGSAKTPEALAAAGGYFEFWGVPSASSHDFERACAGSPQPYFAPQSAETCKATATSKAFLRLPTSCTGPMPWDAQTASWENLGAVRSNGAPDLSDPAWKTASIVSHKAPGFPFDPDDPATPWGAPQGTEGCGNIPVKGKLQAQPTSIDTQTSSGLEVHVEVPSPGLENPEGISSSDLKKVVVSLPEGMTINPSQADGLGVCSPARYESTELSFHPSGASGCPNDSKIGTVLVKSPILEETIPGSVYVAKPFDNPFGSLLALYVVLEEPQRGILIKMAAKVETNEKTGQITTTFDDLPQLPFSSFDFKFREGARAPLATPAACGAYETAAEITGWSDPGNPITSISSFDIIHGIGGGPCPSGGLPPFKPGLIAGSLNNAAGKYSPFNVRLFRTDAEQEFTNFSIKLPPGISGKLAGVPFCPDAAIAAAKTKTGEQELASPSCLKASEVGRTLAGAGVGSVLTYAPGKIYLAGPYNGSALSIASVTAAKVGPFDLGTVVVRLALRVDPETAEVFVDATGSDPIPHIIDGITVHLRDIRAYVDKPEFALNPTSCARTSTSSTLLGSGLDFSSAIDDRPVTVSTPYQAADCAALAFKPDLKLSLKGGTKRAGHPALKAVLKMKPGMANISRIEATLPKSEFLDQSHIGTVCTRVQYVKDQCPAKSIYGYARAFTPILDEPLEGPVYLRSSEHKLPDLVAGLKSGKIEIDVVGRIDSVDGRIRSTFETVPDAPLSKAVLMMQGGKKGLLENSTNLCAKAHRATVEFDAHNGKFSDVNPVLKPQCSKAKKKAARQKRAAR